MVAEACERFMGYISMVMLLRSTNVIVAWRALIRDHDVVH